MSNERPKHSTLSYQGLLALEALLWFLRHDRLSDCPLSRATHLLEVWPVRPAVHQMDNNLVRFDILVTAFMFLHYIPDNPGSVGSVLTIGWVFSISSGWLSAQRSAGRVLRASSSSDEGSYGPFSMSVTSYDEPTKYHTGPRQILNTFSFDGRQ